MLTLISAPAAKFFFFFKYPKGQFTLLIASCAIAQYHMSAAGIIQRYHLNHWHECMLHMTVRDGAWRCMTVPEFNYDEPSRSALWRSTPCDTVKSVNMPYIKSRSVLWLRSFAAFIRLCSFKHRPTDTTGSALINILKRPLLCAFKQNRWVGGQTSIVNNRRSSFQEDAKES